MDLYDRLNSNFWNKDNFEFNLKHSVDVWNSVKSPSVSASSILCIIRNACLRQLELHRFYEMSPFLRTVISMAISEEGMDHKFYDQVIFFLVFTRA